MAVGIYKTEDIIANINCNLVLPIPLINVVQILLNADIEAYKPHNIVSDKGIVILSPTHNLYSSGEKTAIITIPIHIRIQMNVNRLICVFIQTKSFFTYASVTAAQYGDIIIRNPIDAMEKIFEAIL